MLGMTTFSGRRRDVWCMTVSMLSWPLTMVAWKQRLQLMHPSLKHQQWTRRHPSMEESRSVHFELAETLVEGAVFERQFPSWSVRLIFGLVTKCTIFNASAWCNGFDHADYTGLHSTHLQTFNSSANPWASGQACCNDACVQMQDTVWLQHTPSKSVCIPSQCINYDIFLKSVCAWQKDDLNLKRAVKVSQEESFVDYEQ